MVVRLWVVVTIDVPRRNERTFYLPRLLGRGIRCLTVLQDCPKHAVGRDRDGEEQERVGIVALAGSSCHRRRGRTQTGVIALSPSAIKTPAGRRSVQASTRGPPSAVLPPWFVNLSSVPSYTLCLPSSHKTIAMDLRHNHGSEIQVVRANHDEAVDLVAIGGIHSVQVLLTVRVSHYTFISSFAC